MLQEPYWTVALQCPHDPTGKEDHRHRKGQIEVSIGAAEQGLIDEYLFMVDPVAIGDGTPIFKGLRQELRLELTMTRAFKSGVLLLSYRPKGN